MTQHRSRLARCASRQQPVHPNHRTQVPPNRLTRHVPIRKLTTVSRSPASIP